MKKIAMHVAVLVASLGISGAAFAGSETATKVNGHPMLAPLADSQVQKATPEAGKMAVVADAKSAVEQKATPEAGKATAAAVVADAKSTTEQKAGQDAKQPKPEAAAKTDAKPVTPAPVAVQDKNAKK